MITNSINYFKGVVRAEKYDAFLVFFLVLSLLFYRTRDAFTNPQFWAEDAILFFEQSKSLGFVSIFEPSAGYLHFIPRFIALIINYLPIPIEKIPLAYNLSAWGVMLGIILMFRHIPLELNSRLKTLIGLSFVLVPSGNEVLSNLTNIQWPLAVLLLFILISDYKQWNNFLYVIVFSISLTGPFAIILAPIVVLRLFLYKLSRRAFIVSFLWFTCCSIQVYFLSTSHRDASSHSLNTDMLVWFDALLNHLLIGYFSNVPMWLGYSLTILVFGSVFYICCSQKYSKNIKMVFISLIIAYFSFGLAGLYTHKQLPNVLHPFGPGARYFYIPHVIFTMMMYITLFKGNYLIKSLIVFPICFSFVSFSHHAERPSFIDLNWKGYSSYFGNVEGIKIPINPLYPNWFLIGRKDSSAKAEYVALNEKNAVNVKVDFNDGYMSSLTEDPQIIFEDVVCDSEYLIFKVDVDVLLSDSDLEMFFSDQSGKFSVINSLRLPIDNGDGVYYFSLPSNSPRYRLDPISSIGKFKINSIGYYCKN